MIKSAVILAGGRGSRLMPSTDTCPKPLMPIANIPMIEYVLEKIPNSVENVYFTVHHLSHKIENYFSKHPRRYAYNIVKEDKPLGTGGALRHIKDKLTEDFVVFNGDVISSLNVDEMVKYHIKKKALATIALWKVDDPTSFGKVTLTENYKITDFVEKPNEKSDSFINAGIYIFSPDVLKYLPDKEVVSIEREVFPTVVKEGNVYGFSFDGFWIDAGTLPRFLEANKLVIKSKLLSENSDIKNTVVKGNDLRIGNNCDIGPYVSISNHVQIGDNVNIKNSILMDYVKIGNNVKIENSIISENRIVQEDVIDKIF